MALFHKKFKVESARLQDYNYSQEGAYFVTICTKDKKWSLGKIVNQKFLDTSQSKIVRRCWLDLPNHYPECLLDEFIIMPNHIHGIIIINRKVETGFKPVSTQSHYSLSEIIRGFKTFSAKQINKIQSTHGKPFWQSRFYDHIIRNDESLNKIREYIAVNPQNWHNDKNNLQNFIY